MTIDELDTLWNKYRLSGLRPAGKRGRRGDHGRLYRTATIQTTPDVCGGSARIEGTRIPVWTLVEARDSGVSEAQMLLDYPGLKAVNLVDAWACADTHRVEIDLAIRRNEVA